MASKLCYVAQIMSDDPQRVILEKRAEILRALIRHENEVTNQRTTWLLVSQGILFVAAASFEKTHWFPAVVVGLAGMVIALSIGDALQNSFESRQYIKHGWRTLLEQSGYKWEDFPPLDGGVGLRVKAWLFPWSVIPRVFIVAWAALLLFFGLR
jgi:hypothetical protein